MADIELASGTRRFGTTLAVDAVTLQVPAGAFFALLGPSGCGKTTVLRLIAGLERPDAGRIALGGRPVAEGATFVPPEDRRLGMGFQSYALWPHMTVRANVAFGLEERRMPKREIRTKVDAALEMVGLLELAERMPSQLSGGQQQRVALARTIAIEPQVLLLDEPLSNLDASLRVQMRRELLELQRKLQLTTIFVTHDQEEANTTSDRMAVLDGGVIQQIGTPQELYDNPANDFVAGFLGTANILEGQMRDGAFVTKGGSTLPVSATGANARRIVLRPQNITLEDSHTEAGVLPGTIRHREFLGSQIRYLVETADGTLIVDTTHGSPGSGHAPGTRVGLRVDSRHAPLLG